MNKEEIEFGDWQRILIGNAPAEFLLEVLIRTVIVYCLLIVVLRFLGKRMNGQITNLEMSVMLTMGAIVSPAMQLPDRGILSGLVAMLCALTFLRVTNLLGFKSRAVEHIVQGTETLLIKDGIIQLDAMAQNRLSHQQIYSALRSSNVYNLSKVKRMYLEAYGMFSIFSDQADRPGLSVLPPYDDEIHTIHRPTAEPTLACTNCGFTAPTAAGNQPCPSCQANQWVNAIL
ncbi:DUF421 domain-containing protein [Larkinella terrae]|uniref:DUF421 domain-containing protein n=1 Tax=Larkinella terrae TaxID=2025311 RepID=A0A7K0EEU8_9BACT|nr:YetF domain-containing protein [Larkinella terrae]MRS60344.1 DUF421 domain-containing protein [Larkinella terrae]